MVKDWTGQVERDKSGAALVLASGLANLDFAAQLQGYYKRCKGNELEIFAQSSFVKAVNTALDGLDATEDEYINNTLLQDLLAGHRGPTALQLHAFANVFMSSEIDFNRDERNAFIQAGSEAVKQEEEHIAIDNARVNPLRATNPDQDLSKASFQEMIEETCRNDGSFSDLLFSKVLPEWELDKQGFCDHLEMLNSQREGKKSFTVPALDTWENEQKPLLRESMSILCNAFGIKPAENQKIAPHEAMLWRITKHHTFTWHDKKGVEALKTAIVECKESKHHGPLVAELCETSGIPFKHMQDLLGTKQLAVWKNGKGHINNINIAIDFVEMVNPCLGYKDGTRQQLSSDIFSLVTGRPNDVAEALKEAQTKGNPGGALFAALTGHGGMAHINERDIDARMKKAGISDFSENAISRMRNPNNKGRGIDIHEKHAEVIMDMLEERIKPMVEKGMYKAITPSQRSECIDVLTGCIHPKKLIKECVAGNMNIGTLVKNASKRKGLSQQGDDSFTSQSGIWGVPGFLNDKRHLQPEVAERLANWFATHYGFDTKEQRQVMALAEGVDLRKSPSTILDEVINGTLERPKALQMLYDQTGLSREGLADAIGVPANLILYSVTQASGGRLASDKMTPQELSECVVSIAKEVGIPKNMFTQFAEQFSNIPRQVALDNLKSDKSTINAR